MATHIGCANQTKLPSQSPATLQSRFDVTIRRAHELKVLLKYFYKGNHEYHNHFCNELRSLNLWGDGFDATGGGLDAFFRDSKELSKTVKSTLDKFKDAVEGGKHYLFLLLLLSTIRLTLWLPIEIQQFSVTRTSEPRLPSSSSPRTPETKPGEFLKTLKALNEGLFRLAPSIENPAQKLPSRSSQRSAAMQSSTTPVAEDNVSVNTNSTVLTQENDSTFSRPEANDNDVGLSAASMTSFSKSSSEVDCTDLVKANKFFDQCKKSFC